MLLQELELYDFYQEKMHRCDEPIWRVSTRLRFCESPVQELPARPSRKRKFQSYAPSFEIRSPLCKLPGGVDLTELPGIVPYGALKLISEIGLDMNCWPTEHHFTSWLTLAPNNKISGGKLLRSRTQPSANQAAKILRISECQP